MSLNLFVPLNDTSYGIVSTNIAKELSNQNRDVAIFPIGGQIHIDPSPFSKQLERAKFFDYNVPCLKIFHQHLMADFIGKGRRIGWPIFELDTFSEYERHSLNSCDELIVCSKWGKKICESNNITIPINVVNLGVDRDIFFEPPKLSSSKTTIFINIGKYEIRKGHDILIQAFDKAFGPNDNVLMILVPTNRFLTADKEQAWANIVKHPKVKIVSRLRSQNELASLIRNAHCGVFPSKAEGWNLPLLECMSCGLPVITTNYSAHTEFCNPNNSRLIEITGLEPAFDYIMPQWFNKQGNWAKIGENEIEQLILHMREIHQLNQNNELQVNLSGIETAKRLSWQNATLNLWNFINF